MVLFNYKQEDAIKLRTRRNERIANNQINEDLSLQEMKTILDMREKYKLARIRSGPCGYYNCLGLVFGSRRVRIFENEDIENILKHDNYNKIPQNNVMEGDVILYKDNGVFVHCGIVVQIIPGLLPNFLVVSKWGNGDEFIHSHRYCVYWNDSMTVEFYRVAPERSYNFNKVAEIEAKI